MEAKSLKPTVSLYVGRFQPFHKGHLHAVQYIIGRSDQLLIVVGSAQYSHTRRNPFTAGERISMVYAALDAKCIERSRYCVFPVPDIHTHNLWVRHVSSYLPHFVTVYTNEPLVKKLFEEDGRYKVDAIPFLERCLYSATEVRRRMVDDADWVSLVPPNVAEYIREVDGLSRMRDLAKTDKPTE